MMVAPVLWQAGADPGESDMTRGAPHRRETRAGRFLSAVAAAVLVLAGTVPIAAQESEAPAADVAASSDDIQALVAPVALYPDPILVVILQASVFPLQIVQADRFLERYAADSTTPQPDDLDPSVIALMNYPDLLGTMNEYLDWTEALGIAVVDQLDATQLAIQDMRRAAYNLGMLQSNEHQKVVEDGPVIRILPAEPDEIAIPRYDPALLLDRMAAADEAVVTVEEAVVEAPAAQPAATAETAPSAEAPAAEAAPAEAAAPVAAAPVAETAPTYAQPVPTYAQPVPVTYAEPTSSYWSTGATFLGGAALGGLLGYAIGDDWFDDDDDDDDDWDWDDDDWDDFKDRFDDEDWDDLADRVDGGRDINIEDSNIVVGGDKANISSDKRERMSNELRARRDGEKVAPVRDRDGNVVREGREGGRTATARRETGKSAGPAPPRAKAKRPAVQEAAAPRATRDVRMPTGDGGARAKPPSAPTRKVASTSPSAGQRTAAARPTGAAKPAAAKKPTAKRAVADAQPKRQVARADTRGASSRAAAKPQAAARPQAASQSRRSGGGALKNAGGSGRQAMAASSRGKASRGGGGRRR
jgi:hypothetical protein